MAQILISNERNLSTGWQYNVGYVKKSAICLINNEIVFVGSIKIKNHNWGAKSGNIKILLTPDVEGIHICEGNLKEKCQTNKTAIEISLLPMGVEYWEGESKIKEFRVCVDSSFDEPDFNVGVTILISEKSRDMVGNNPFLHNIKSNYYVRF